MRNSRTFMAILIVLVLLSVSIIALSVWGYRLYFAQNQKSKQLTAFSKTNHLSHQSNPEQLPVVQKDTLTIHDTTALLRQKLSEIDRLQFEVRDILEKRKNHEKNSVDVKLNLLRDSIDHLKFRNEKIAEENRFLARKINQISGEKEKKTAGSKSKKANSATKTNTVPSVLISSMNFYGITENSTSTNSVNSSTGFRGTFFVKSNNIPSGELMVVVKAPGGKILMNSPWESGVFPSEDGNKVYSAKLHFDAPDQKLNFSVEASDLKKGTYTVEVYYQGRMIATLKKTMS